MGGGGREQLHLQQRPMQNSFCSEAGRAGHFCKFAIPERAVAKILDAVNKSFSEKYECIRSYFPHWPE
jgi:hypothetical protein